MDITDMFCSVNQHNTTMHSNENVYLSSYNESNPYQIAKINTILT